MLSRDLFCQEKKFISKLSLIFVPLKEQRTEFCGNEFPNFAFVKARKQPKGFTIRSDIKLAKDWRGKFRIPTEIKLTRKAQKNQMVMSQSCDLENSFLHLT